RHSRLGDITVVPETDPDHEPQPLCLRQNIIMSSPQRPPHTPSPSRASVIGRQRAGQLAPTDTGKAREAQSCHDAYGTVAVMAWPLGVALKQGRLSFAERELKKCLALASRIEPRASQAYARLKFSGAL